MTEMVKLALVLPAWLFQHTNHWLAFITSYQLPTLTVQSALLNIYLQKMPPD